MSVVILLFVSAALYALFDFFAAKGASETNAYLANIIFNGLGALIPLIFLGILYSKQSKPLVTKHGAFMNLLAGISIALFSILLVKIFARGGNLAYVLPVIYGLVIVFGALLGFFVLKETISMMQLAGIVVTAIGVSLVIFSKVSS